MQREVGLVPVSTIEQRELLTGKQKDVLVRLGLHYLQNKKIVINPITVEAVGEVMLDALDRGLRAQGKSFISGKEGVAKFVESGLGQRDAIMRTARIVVEEADSLRVNGSYFGPMALPSGLIEGAKGELADFFLNPKVDRCEQIVLMAQKRQEELENLVEFAILQLPEEVQFNARKRALTRDEKAKLVRNLITSLVFRNTPNPIITTDQLLEINRLFSEDPENFFTAEDKEKVLAVGGYIGDLFEQTKELFRQSHSVSFDSKDQLFRIYWKGLLLLHPALEEEPISSDPQDIGRRQTLWDEGYTIEMDGFLIPKVDVLMAAMRQADAAGWIRRYELFHEAYKLWRQLETDKQNYSNKVRNLEARIANQKERLRKLTRTVKLTLPKEDLRFADVAVQIAQKKASESKSAWEFARNTVARSRARLRRISIFKNRFEKSLEEGSQIEAPRDIYIEILNKNLSLVSRTITGLENRLTTKSERVKRIFEIYRDMGLLDSRIRDVLNLDAYSERELFDLLQREAKRISQSKSDHIFDSSNLIGLKRYAMSQLVILTRSASARRAAGLGNLSASDLERLDRYLKRDLLSYEVLQVVSRATLQRFANYLGPVVEGKRRLSRLRINRSEIKGAINLCLNGALIPKSAYESLEVGDLYREAMVSSLPRALEGKRAEEAERLIGIDNIDSIKAVMPERIDKREIRKSISRYLKDGKLRHRSASYSFEARAEAARRFMELMSSSVLSLKYAKGMETERYLDLLARKITLIHRYFSIPKLKEEYDEAVRNLRNLKRQREVIASNLVLVHLETEYQELLKRKPETIFLKRFRSLHLAVPVQG